MGGSGGALGELWEAQGQLWEALAELWEALGELWEGLYIEKPPTKLCYLYGQGGVSNNIY